MSHPMKTTPRKKGKLFVLFKLLANLSRPLVFGTYHLTCLLRNLYAGQEATVRTGHGTTDWFQIGKGVRQGCIFSPCLFSLYAEYIMKNAGLEEAQAGIKIAGKNMNNFRYMKDIKEGKKEVHVFTDRFFRKIN